MTEKFNQTAIDKFQKDFGGDILLPEDPSYDQARKVFNTIIERRPAVIARCSGQDDVVRAIHFARDHDLEIAVRAGGHSVAGWGLSEGGIVIDLRRMNGVEVDPNARTARVAGGATWKDLDQAGHSYGLATTGGTSPSTGVGGVTLGGGWGYLARKYGLGCDNLLAVKLVTAEGKTVVASEEEHPELFWALHGGGGNFGIATELTFQMHPVPAATIAYLAYSPDAGPRVIDRLCDVMEKGPDELCVELVYMTGPSEDFVPSHLVNQLCLMMIIFYAGPEAEAEKVIKPFLEIGPGGKMIAEMSYLDIQAMGDIGSGFRHHSSSEHLTDLPGAAIDKFCARAHDMMVPSDWLLTLSTWGGQIARRAADWPLADRDKNWHIYPFFMWTDPGSDRQVFDWIKGLRADLAPYVTGSPYLNLVAGEGRVRMIAGYGGEVSYRRLAGVKSEYDPHNLFRNNHNIIPE